MKAKQRYGRMFDDKSLIKAQLNGTDMFNGYKYGKVHRGMRPKSYEFAKSHPKPDKRSS